MTPILTSISPVSGAPGTAITLTGSGFDPTARVGCPVLVDTVFTSSTSLQAAIPADIAGPEGGSMLVGVFVQQNADASISAMLQFTVLFPAVDLQTWTSIDLVCGEIPMFQRGGNGIADASIRAWMKSIAQSVAGVLLGRGLPLDPTQWQQATATTAFPTAEGVLEQIVRYGAAARLAAVVSSQFSQGGEWGLAKNLRDSYNAEFKLLSTGKYDKLFSPTAATVESGQLVSAGDASSSFGGCTTQKFFKDQVF